MSAFARILVGVDGRDGGADALALGGLLKEAGGGELVAVHVYPFDRSVSIDRAEEYEAGFRDELVGHLTHEIERAGVAARPVVVADPSPARALHKLAAEEHADVIVVGSTHRAQPYRVLLGDATAGTLHGAPCAVAVAPRGLTQRPGALRRIGVGVDASHEARDALELARRLATAQGASVTALVVVAPPLPVWPTSAYEDWPDYESAAISSGDRLLADVLAETGDGVRGETLVGSPGSELARRSRELDLLVLGSRSYGPLRRLLLGSTSNRVVHEAACSVLVLPRAATAGHEAAEPASAGAAAQGP
ncbi:MAG: universal stress protein [Solirubrobacteraceae bacterium]